MQQKKPSFHINFIQYAFLALVFVSVCLAAYGQASDTLTIVTYYPAPYGSYKQLYTEFLGIRNKGAPIYPLTLTLTYPGGTTGGQAWQTAIGFDPGAMAIVWNYDEVENKGGLLFGVLGFRREFFWEDIVENEVIMQLNHEGSLAVAKSISIGTGPTENAKLVMKDGEAQTAFAPVVGNYGNDVSGREQLTTDTTDTCDGNNQRRSRCNPVYSGTCRDVFRIAAPCGKGRFMARDIKCYKETRIVPLYVDKLE